MDRATSGLPVIGLAALCLATAGCPGGNPTEEPTPTPSAGATPTEQSTQTAPPTTPTAVPATPTAPAPTGTVTPATPTPATPTETPPDPTVDCPDQGFCDATPLCDTSTVEDVDGLSAIVAIDSGWHHILAVTDGGLVMAWGRNDYGQLGDGQIVAGGTHGPVTAGGGLTGAVAVSGGARHSLAIDGDGALWAWGDNRDGQLGDGDDPEEPHPTVPVKVSVDGAVVVQAAAGGAHSLALTEQGEVWAWGDNSHGQLGDGTTEGSRTPVQVQANWAGHGEVVDIAAGRAHSLAVLSDGTVWGWGDSDQGQLGTNHCDAAPRMTPFQIPGLSGVATVAAGYSHSLAMTGVGDVWGWGLNDHGQVGACEHGEDRGPRQALNLISAVAIDAGAQHSVALDTNGDVWVWGDNAAGQLGYEGSTDFGVCSSAPRPILHSALSGAKGATAGAFHAAAIESSDGVGAWGVFETLPVARTR